MAEHRGARLRSPGASEERHDALQRERTKQWDSVGRLLLLVGLPVAPFLYFVLSHVDFVPIWDGAAYSTCVIDSIHARDVLALNCYGHPSIAYFGILAIAELFTGETATGFIVANALLGSLAILAFVWSIGRLFPEAGALERGLVGAVFGLWPPLAASALNPNPDYGMVVFFVIAFAGLVTRRRLLAVVAGIALVLSKDQGVMLFALAAVAYALVVGVRSRHDFWREFRFHLPLLVVPAVFALYVIYKIATHQPLIWSGGGIGPGLDLNPLHVTDRPFLSYLSLIFVLDFAWLMAAALGIGAVAGVAIVVVRMLRSRGGSRFAGAIDRRVLFVAVVFVGLLYLLTRYRVFSNARYFLALVPVMVLLTWLAVRAVVPWVQFRQLLLLAFAVLLVFTANNTVDPLSRRLYGTFPVGQRDMLLMTSLTGECCGYGRDQLIYNLEFTNYDYVMDDALADLRPHQPNMVAVSGLEDFFLVPAVNRAATHRALNGPGTKRLNFLWTQFIPAVKPRPPVVYLFDFPNVDVSFDKRLLERSGYSEVQVKTYNHEGLVLKVHVMKLR